MPFRATPNGRRIQPTIRFAVVFLSTMLFAACDDRLARDLTPPSSGSRRADVVANADSNSGSYELRCPPWPPIKSRAIAPGTESDLNANGIVCDDFRDGVDALPTRTLDDVQMPIAPPAEAPVP